MNEHLFRRIAIYLAGPITLLVGIDWWVAWHFNTDAPHSISVIGAGMLAFAFTYSVKDGAEQQRSDAALRSALAAAIVVQYLVLVSIVSFFHAPNDTQSVLPEVTKTLLSSFTTIVGVVVAFYFGSSAYLQANSVRKEDRAPVKASETL